MTAVVLNRYDRYLIIRGLDLLKSEYISQIDEINKNDIMKKIETIGKIEERLKRY